MASLGLVTALIALGMFAAFSGRTDPSLAFSFALGADNDQYRWAAMIVIFMTGLPFGYALWRLSRMLSCVERGEVFSGGSVSHLRAFALWVFVSAVASIVLPLLVNSAFGLIGGLPADAIFAYGAFDDHGDPISAVITTEHHGDAGIWMVATVPWARHQGLARRLMRRALRDAQERGCTTTTLLASKLGAPVYTAMGYDDLGPLELWERRP